MPKWQDNRLCDAKKSDLQVRLDSRMKLQFCGSKVTSDARLLAPDEALRFTEMGTDLLTDSRRDCNKQHLLVPLLRQSIYSRLAGYEEVNDTERLAVDPAMCHVVGGRQHRPTTKRRRSFRARDSLNNLTALMNLSGNWIDKVQQCQPLQELILELDSSVSETYGEQESSAYNELIGCPCYHPLFCSTS